jgi:hypothetical protein
MNATTLPALLAAALTAGLPTYALAKDACKDVKFVVVNQHSARIRVTKIMFWNSHASRTQTEDVRNEECARGQTCVTNGDNLGNAHLTDLYHIRAVYEERENDQSWSRPFVSSQWLEPVGSDRRCTNGKYYRFINIPGPPADPRK